MKTHQRGRHTEDSKWGQSRLFISANDSSVTLQPGQDSYAIDWSTKTPAVLALGKVLERDLTETPLRFVTVIHGEPSNLIEKPASPKVVQQFFDLVEAYENCPANPANQFAIACFDFPTRSLALSAVPPHFGLTGISYLISRVDDKPLPADVEAVRLAITDTIDDSLKPELDWILEALNS